MTFAVAGILLLGAVLRLFEYSGRRPLWLDESMLALNVGRRSFGALVARLDYDQVAPVLFLWIVKAVTLVAGMGEYSLRLIPLLCGLLLPWLMWRMTRTMAGSGVAFVALGFTAVSVPLIYYSAELKPYGIDAFVSAALVLLALRVRSMPAHPASWWHLTVGGVVGLMASVPAPFVLAGIGVALLADPAVRRAAGALKRMVILAVSCAVCFGVLYATVYHPGSSNPYMQLFWAGTFLDPGAPDLAERGYRAGLAIAQPFPPLPSFVRVRWLMGAIAVGLMLLFRKAGLPVALMLAVPYIAVVAGSALGVYPMADRLLLFLAPGSLVAVSVLIWRLLRLSGMGEEAAGIAGLLLVLGWSAPSIIANGRAPIVKSEAREIAEFVAHSSRSEPVYVTAGGIPTWMYYSIDWRSPDTTRLDRIARLAAASAPSTFNSLVPSLIDQSTSPGPMSWGRDGVELIGRRSGLAIRKSLGMVRWTPDSGWARREVDRIVAVATPYAWVYAATWPEMELPAFYDEFARRGIVIVVRFEQLHAVALRIRVPLKP